MKKDRPRPSLRKGLSIFKAIALIAVIFFTATNIAWPAFDLCLRPLARVERGGLGQEYSLFTLANTAEFFKEWGSFTQPEQAQISAQLAKSVLGKSAGHLTPAERKHIAFVASNLYVGWHSLRRAEQEKIVANLNASKVTPEYLRKVRAAMTAKAAGIPEGEYSAPEVVDLAIDPYDPDSHLQDFVQRFSAKGKGELRNTVFVITAGGPGSRLEKSLQRAIQIGQMEPDGPLKEFGAQAEGIYKRLTQAGIFSKLTFPTGPVSENSALITTMETLSKLSKDSGVDFPVIVVISDETERAIMRDVTDNGVNIRLKNMVTVKGSMYPSLLQFGYLLTSIGADGMREPYYSPGGTFEVLKALKNDMHVWSTGETVRGEEFIDRVLTQNMGAGYNKGNVNYPVLYGDDPTINEENLLLTLLGTSRDYAGRRRADVVGVGIKKTSILAPYGGTYVYVKSPDGQRYITIVEAGPREQIGSDGKAIRGVPDMTIPLNQAEAAEPNFNPFNTGMIMFFGTSLEKALKEENFPIDVASRQLPDDLNFPGGLVVNGIPYYKPEEYLTKALEVLGRSDPNIRTMISNIHIGQYGATKQWQHVVRERLKKVIISSAKLVALGVKVPYKNQRLKASSKLISRLDLDKEFDPLDAGAPQNVLFRLASLFDTPIELGVSFRLVNEPSDVRIEEGAQIYLNGDIEIEDGTVLTGTVIIRSGGKIKRDGTIEYTGGLNGMNHNLAAAGTLLQQI